MPMTYALLMRRWPRFASKLTAALAREGRVLQRERARLEIDMPVYTHWDSGLAIDAGIVLNRSGLRQGSVAGLRVLDIPERPAEHDVAELAQKLNAVAAARLRGERPSGAMPVFVYPPTKD